MPPLSGPLIDERRTPFRFNITNNNHTVMVQLVGGKNLYLEGGPLPRRYYLDHFAFHWGSNDDRGSEHTNGCERAAMEVQVGLYSKCWTDYKDALEQEDFYALKIGVLMKIVKEDNPSLAPIVSALPSVRQPGQSASPEEPLVYDGLLGDPIEDFFAYKGSLNMPPCHRRIWWLIYLFGKGISESQVSAFRELRTTAGPMVNNYREPRELDLGTLLASDKNSLCSGRGRKCSSKHTNLFVGHNLGKYRYCGN